MAAALARRFPPIDVSPMSNLAGQIRVPGSPHKLRDGRLTGYMHIAMPLQEAIDIATHPCSDRVWERLHDELAVELDLYAPSTRKPATASLVGTALQSTKRTCRGYPAEKADVRPGRTSASVPGTGDWSGYRSRSECLLTILNRFATGVACERLQRCHPTAGPWRLHRRMSTSFRLGHCGARMQLGVLADLVRETVQAQAAMLGGGPVVRVFAGERGTRQASLEEYVSWLQVLEAAFPARPELFPRLTLLYHPNRFGQLLELDPVHAVLPAAATPEVQAAWESLLHAGYVTVPAAGGSRCGSPGCGRRCARRAGPR
ncbi:hypothetical protein ACIBI9_59235 [Nonomuraea sp. NPDC050451]|uniref:hypothetical protein n=1 Tax=Nonomuraea sp. NPDC050451 TaxID=3364364 RepID=UPI003797CE99